MTADLHAVVELHLGDFHLDAQLQVPAGQVLAVVGPNGSGKSTLLRVLAGLLRPARGTVHLGDRLLTDAGGGVLVRPRERQVGLLSQDPALFPHLSAVENVAFGPRSTGMRPRAARQLALRWLDRVGMAEHARHRPGRLSGGQQQRVAIARALAAEPEVLLLDEPLAALDVQTAPQVRQLLAEQVRASGATTVIVSHDVLDAVVLADRIAVLHQGQVAEHGSVTEVLAAPRSPFAATLAGVNLITGTGLEEGRVRTPLGDWQVSHDGAGAPGQPQVRPGQAMVLRVRPSAVVLGRERPQGANVARTTVRWVEPADGGVRLRLAGPPELVADVPATQVHPAWLTPGAEVWLQVDPQDVRAGVMDDTDPGEPAAGAGAAGPGVAGAGAAGQDGTVASG